MPDLLPSLEAGARSWIIIAWVKSGNVDQSATFCHRVNQLIDSNQLAPMALEDSLRACWIFAEAINDFDMASHFERALRNFQQQFYGTAVAEESSHRNPTDQPSGTSAPCSEGDNERDDFLEELETVESELQNVETQLSEISAHAEADNTAYRANRDFAIRNTRRAGAATGVPGLLIPRQLDPQLQVEQQQLEARFQELQERKALLEQKLGRN